MMQCTVSPEKPAGWFLSAMDIGAASSPKSPRFDLDLLVRQNPTSAGCGCCLSNLAETLLLRIQILLSLLLICILAYRFPAQSASSASEKNLAVTPREFAPGVVSTGHLSSC